MSLEEKRKLFITEIIEISEQYRSDLRLFTHLNQLQLEKYFEYYNKKLELLKDPIAVKLYAQELIQTNIAGFNNVIAQEQYANYASYRKYALYAGAGIAITLIAFALIRAWIDNSALIEGATLARKTAELGAKTTENLEDTQVLVKEGFVKMKSLCETLVIDAMQKYNVNVEDGFQKAYNSIKAIEIDLAEIKDNVAKFIP